jgi:hypothetical protein
VTLTGTGTAVGTLTFASATNATVANVLGIRTLTFTIPSPRAPVTSTLTITNTGVGPLAITADNLLINIGGLYSLVAPASGTPCSFTVPLAGGASCTVGIHYATPAAVPAAPDIGALTVTNNGTGTIAGVSGLALSAR